MMEIASGTYPYPAQKPQCLRTGLSCLLVEGLCPSRSLPEACEYLETGANAVADHAMLGVTQEALQREQAENKQSRYDKVLPGFFTGDGIRREIATNEELRMELQDGAWGVLYSDLRGLKGVNERHGKPMGDNLLRLAGRRLMVEAGIRIRDVPVPINRRQNDEAILDIGVRDAGSDELLVIVRQVDTKAFASVALRQHLRFSVPSAVEDSEKGHVPTILSFAGVHASELDPALLINPTDAFDTAIILADERHLSRKNEQYDLMWSMTFEVAIRAGEQLQRPNDHRGIADLFMAFCCPQFFAHEHELLINSHRD